MMNLQFYYTVIYCDKVTYRRDWAIYRGTFSEVLEQVMSSLAKDNYILDIKRS